MKCPQMGNYNAKVARMVADPLTTYETVLAELKSGYTWCKRVMDRTS